MMNSAQEQITLFLKEKIENPSTTDILINADESIFIDMGLGLQKTPCPEALFKNEFLKQWLVTQFSLQGKSWDARFPFMDFLFLGQHRGHVCFPPVYSNGVLISIRKIPSAHSVDQSLLNIQKNWESQNGFDFLKKAVLHKETILVCGATGSGKTTLSQTLLNFIPHHERILCLEDTPELNPLHPHFIRLNSKPSNSDGFGEITMKDLLKQTLRMRPDRIILGECRGHEVLELLQLLNTGHRGTIATLHANSTRDGLKRLELLCSLAAHGTIPHFLVKELISEGIQWIVHVEQIEGQRKIKEISQLAGKEGDTILLRQMLNLK